MPSGIIHANITRKAGKLLTIVGIVGSITIGPLLLALPLGGWLGHCVSPDQDHHKITYMEGRLLRTNRFIGILWIWYWKPYERLIPHRGSSHTWPKGTIVRMAYLLWPFILVSVYLGFTFSINIQQVFQLLTAWLLVFAGWSIQDWIHILQDGE